MFYKFTHLHIGKLQVVFVVVAMVIAFAVSAQADLSDPTLSVTIVLTRMVIPSKTVPFTVTTEKLKEKS